MLHEESSELFLCGPRGEILYNQIRDKFVLFKGGVHHTVSGAPLHAIFHILLSLSFLSR
jgi:hypothetical protein